jgi:ATP-dependent RNA helicase DeaD
MSAMNGETNVQLEGGFETLGLDGKLIKALVALGYEEPTPIQRQAIPPLLEGRDFVGQAATGTGKTAAFALPLIHRLGSEPAASRPQPSVLILVPTRELAQQVAEAVHKYGKALHVSVVPIYGGQAFTQQFRALDRGVDIVVATPGRALDHIGRQSLKLDAITTVVLDEADEMLDMGFAEDLEAILSATPKERQTVLFSATMPARIASIAKRHLTNPVRIAIAKEAGVKGSQPKVRQTAYVVQRAHKVLALSRVLDLEDPASALVFCRTRTMVDELTEKLSARGYRAQALHGGMTQEQRGRVIQRLKAGKADLVVATDVAARGLDIEQLSHVVNYDVPATAESYVHRIGRVGRAGREGVAITMAEPRESRLLRQFEQAARGKIELARVPTMADLHARRLESTRVALQETILAGELDTFRVAVESLTQEHDLMDVALAAVKLAHQAVGGDQESEEIPEPTFEGRGRQGGQEPRTYVPAGKGGKPAKAGKGRTQGGSGTGGMVRLYISAGRSAGIRPQDLVGAIAGEAGISGKHIGAIDIADRFSLVEIAEELAADVIAALRSSKIKGKKVMVREDRGA